MQAFDLNILLRNILPGQYIVHIIGIGSQPTRETTVISGDNCTGVFWDSLSKTSNLTWA